KVFSGDRATSHKDIYQYVGFGKLSWSGYEAGQWDLQAGQTGAPVFQERRFWSDTTLPAAGVTPTVSPDTSLSTLVSLIRSARRSLDIEQLNFDPDWGGRSGASPLLAEVEAAARRGVQVRVLLNDDAAFGGGDPGDSNNKQTVMELTRVARQYRLALGARIA